MNGLIREINFTTGLAAMKTKKPDKPKTQLLLEYLLHRKAIDKHTARTHCLIDGWLSRAIDYIKPRLRSKGYEVKYLDGKYKLIQSQA